MFFETQCTTMMSIATSQKMTTGSGNGNCKQKVSSTQV